MKIDKNKIYYLSHPCTSNGEMEKNKKHEELCFRKITAKQQTAFIGDGELLDKINVIRPLTVIPPDMEYGEAMKRCLVLLSACDAIILCGNWEHSTGCLIEKEQAERLGIDVINCKDVCCG